tara:strand:- start:143 stop:361 length:219 start_codon:yes stop_codon:yes gene_type:complete
MYKIIFLSSSILILSPIFIILLKKYCKSNNLDYVPQLKKSPSPRIRREHIHLEIPDDLQLDNNQLTPIDEEP